MGGGGGERDLNLNKINYNDLPIIRKEYQLTPVGVYSLKGNSGLSISWAQMKKHENSKRTSHH